MLRVRFFFARVLVKYIYQNEWKLSNEMKSKEKETLSIVLSKLPHYIKLHTLI